MSRLNLRERWDCQCYASEPPATSPSAQIGRTGCRNPVLLRGNLPCLGCHKEPLYILVKSHRHGIMGAYTSYFRHQQRSIPKANFCLGVSIKHNRESAKLVIMRNLLSSCSHAFFFSLSLSFNITKQLLKHLPLVGGGLLRQCMLQYLRGTSRPSCRIGVSRESYTKI